MSRLYSFAPEEFYHIYNRGIEKRLIFIDNLDYERFIRLLFLCNGIDPVDSRDYKGLSFAECVEKVDKDRENLVYIGAYCLMPNHFHLLIKERDPSGVSTLMRKLLTAYSMYFNTRYVRTGRLFETSYQSVHIEHDNHLKYLFAYIHLNPLKITDPYWMELGVDDRTQAIKYLSNYRFSSLLDFINNNRDTKIILNKEQFPDYSVNEVNFVESMFEWIEDYKG